METVLVQIQACYASLSFLWGYVGGKFALSLESVSGWVGGRKMEKGQRSEFTFIHYRLLSETVTSSKVGKGLWCVV